MTPAVVVIADIRSGLNPATQNKSKDVKPGTKKNKKHQIEITIREEWVLNGAYRLV